MKCENCGCDHDGSYGSGRFCSDHCRRSFCGKLGTCKKIGKPHPCKTRKPLGTWICKRCGIVFDTRKLLIDHNHTFHPILNGRAWNKGLSKSDPRVLKQSQTLHRRYANGEIESHNKGKHLSNEHKKAISLKMKQFIRDNPDKVPYVLNHSSKESYPERFFRKAFINEDFPTFIQDKYVNGYFLDFAFDEYKVYVEVDGEQHYVDKTIVNHDIERTKRLNETEWRCVCRIRWSKFQKLTSEHKHLFILGLKRKIKNFSKPSLQEETNVV